MVCPKCGSPIGKNEQYCSNCGYPVSDVSGNGKKKSTGLLVFIVVVEILLLAAVAGFLFVNMQKNREETKTEQSDGRESGEKKDTSAKKDSSDDKDTSENTDASDKKDSGEEDTEENAEAEEKPEEKKLSAEPDPAKANSAEPEPEPEPGPEPRPESEPEPAPASASAQTPAEAALITDPASIDGIRSAYQMLSTDKVLSASASTTIHQDKVQSPPINILDGDPMTNWQEGAAGSGIGEYVEFQFKQEYTVGALTLKLGNWKTDRYFYGNNRPRTLTISMNGQSWQKEFPDEWKECALQFTTPVVTDNLKITIDDVYRGSDWDDTVITDICVWHN